MRISDWSSDVCSSDLQGRTCARSGRGAGGSAPQVTASSYIFCGCSTAFCPAVCHRRSFLVLHQFFLTLVRDPSPSPEGSEIVKLKVSSADLIWMEGRVVRYFRPLIPKVSVKYCIAIMTQILAQNASRTNKRISQSRPEDLQVGK